MDSRDFEQYRKKLVNRGFITTNYFSANGFNIKKMKELAMAGKMDAMQCVIGKTIRWYYSENQAELARLKGELN